MSRLSLFHTGLLESSVPSSLMLWDLCLKHTNWKKKPRIFQFDKITFSIKKCHRVIFQFSSRLISLLARQEKGNKNCPQSKLIVLFSCVCFNSFAIVELANCLKQNKIVQRALTNHRKRLRFFNQSGARQTTHSLTYVRFPAHGFQFEFCRLAYSVCCDRPDVITFALVLQALIVKFTSSLSHQSYNLTSNVLG